LRPALTAGVGVVFGLLLLPDSSWPRIVFISIAGGVAVWYLELRRRRRQPFAGGAV
jgi:hypothetical protein